MRWKNGGEIMRQQDIIKALQKVNEKSAVQLGEQYHGIADIDHERLLKKVEQRLDAKHTAQSVPEIQEPPQISASPSRQVRVPWLTIGTTAACCMIGLLGVGMIWHMQQIAPTNQPPETMTEATTTQYPIQHPVVTETTTTVSTENRTTANTTTHSTSATAGTTTAVSTISLPAVQHTSTVQTTVTETTTLTTQQTSGITQQSSVTVYIPQSAPVPETKVPQTPAETQTIRTTVSVRETTTAPLTEPVSTNDAGQIITPDGSTIELPSTSTTETIKPPPPTQTALPTEAKKPMTMEDLHTIAANADAMTWDDFMRYDFEDVGSGIAILKYDLGNGYALYVYGVPEHDTKPDRIELRKEGDKRGVDIRTDDIDAYLTEETT
jgi:cytoskeletal protein RodZ